MSTMNNINCNKIPVVFYYFTVHYIAILWYKFYTQLCVNFKITVNTSTCTDAFTVITIKDQSGGTCSTGGQRFMAVSKQTACYNLAVL